MSGLLSTAISGLMAFQRSLDTTSHNITNVNTEGYSRQQTNLSAVSLTQFSHGGVQVDSITRHYDQFINGQLRSSTSAFSDVESYQLLAKQVDNLLANSDTGLAPVIQDFFDSANDVANNPSSTVVRDILLVKGDDLTNRFAALSHQIQTIGEQVNVDLRDMTEHINTYTQSIAQLNTRINSDLGIATHTFNDLLDQRDTMLTNLAELIDIAVIPQTNGMVSVVMSHGQPLVMGGVTNQLGIQSNPLDPTQLDVTLIEGNQQAEVMTNRIQGGRLAGVLRFREEVLDASQQKLGAVAASIAVEFNRIHQAGFDLEGNQGQAFFNMIGDEVPVFDISNPLSPATLTATFEPTSSENIDVSDYVLKFDGANYTLMRSLDKSVIRLNDVSGVLTPADPIQKLAGIQLTIEGTPNANDEFFIRPTFHAARQLQLNLSDSNDIAAATNVDAAGNVVSGAMVGDNRNMLKLAELANQTVMFAGTASFQEAYGQIVSRVGGLTQTANITAIAQQAVLDRATESREAISGVNLDEEAANLIKFQQSYQAAAQTVAIAGTVFDTLLAAIQ